MIPRNKRRPAPVLTPVALAGALVLSTQAACAQTITPDADARAARTADRILAALVEANGVPGMGAAVWRDGQIAWTGAAGHRDIEQDLPVDENTVFRLASVSKLFAVAAAARLREQGALDVEAPVRSIVSYLPDSWPAITTSQLAAHTAGIPHYQAVDANRGGRRFTSVREAVALFEDRDLLDAPGAAYEYSSWGYVLISAAVEESAGQPYLDFLAGTITPGLAIGPDATDTANPDASIAYEFADGSIRRAAAHDYSYGWGGAGLSGTAPDLARWGGRVLTGDVVSFDSFEWMLTPARLSDGSIVRQRDYPVGFGWRGGHDGDGDRIAHHAGVTNGARSILMLYPDGGLAVSVLSNALWVSSIEQTAMMIAAPFKPSTTHAGGDVPCPTDALAYDGAYDGAPLTGSASFRLEDGICVGRIGVENAFGGWLNSFLQNDADALQIIGLDPDGGLGRAALVTPIGVFDLRAGDDGSRHEAALSATRSFTMTLRSQ